MGSQEGCSRHDLDLEVDVNVIKHKPDVAEAAMHFSDGRVGGFHL
jgi:hypothetical protein